jgi:hypothetical protein
LVRFSSSGTRILESQALSERFGWSDSAQEFFLVLLTLVRYLNLYLQREPYWIDSLKSHGLPTEPPFDWRENEAVAVLLIERALGLIENWPTNVEKFVRANRTRFKRLRAEYGTHFPKTLVDLISEKIEHDAINQVESVEFRFEDSHDDKERSPQDRVGQAVQYLLETNAPVSFRGVCRIAKVSFARLNNDARLNEIVLQGKSLFKLKQEAEIKDAIRELRSRDLNLSMRSIATYLGRSHRYLNAHKIASIAVARTNHSSLQTVSKGVKAPLES